MNNCLTTEQILFVAWRLDEDSLRRDHVAQCETCRRQVDLWRTVPERLRSELAGERQMAAGRDRLLETLQSEASVVGETIPGKDESLSAPAVEPPESSLGLERHPAVTVSPIRKFGAFAMRHKQSLSAVCVLVLLAVVFWPLPGSGEGLAQETARAINKAKSVRFQMTQKATVDVGGKPREMTLKGRGFWRASGDYRMEISRDGQVEQVSIMFLDRLGIDIDHRRKAFRTISSRAGKMSPLMRLQQLGRFQGRADQILGDRDIEGAASSGFEVAMNKVDDAVENGTMEVWVSKKSHLPVRVIHRMKFGPQDVTIVMDKFSWNVALEESLFNATPPPGYTDSTPVPPSAAEQTEKITQALEVYAKAFDGQYPRGRTVYGDVVISQVSEKLGLSALAPAEQLKLSSYEDFVRARHGFAMLSVLLRDNPKAVWNGSSVTAKDKGKVLLSWQTADGFQVLFGDLTAKSVRTEAELRKLR